MGLADLSRTKKAVLVGLAAGFIAVLVFPTKAGLSLEEEFGLSWLFRMRGPVEKPPDTVVIRMDAEEAVRLNQPKLRDWQRSLHAKLVDKLVDRGASVIVFDIFFENPRDEDPVFAAAIARSGRVILAESLEQKKIGGVDIVESRKPAPELAKASRALGPFPLPKVPVRVSRFWLFLSSDEAVAALPMTALQLHALRAISHEELEPWLRAADYLLPQQSADAIDLPVLMRHLRDRLQQQRWRERMLHATAENRALPASSRRILNALIHAYGGMHSALFNFYGPDRTIETLAYSDFLNDSAGESDLSGKVVFVGGAPGLDDYFTVFSSADGVDLTGVEILATAFANLLDNATLRQSSLLADLLAIMVFGFAAGVIAFSLPGLYAMVVVPALGAAYFALALFLFEQYYLWLPVFVPLVLQLPFALLAGLFVQYYTVKRAEENIARALEIYVPPELVTRLVRDRDALRPQQVYGTCVSSDVAGYTVLSEKLKNDPLKLAGLSREYFDLIGGAIGRHKGLMLEIVGDGLTSFWQHPADNRYRRLSACRAALEMLQAVTVFNERHPEHQFPTRIGLYAGEVALGNMGGGPHFIFGVAGDPANTASRIEGLNKYVGTRLLAEQSVVDGLDELLLRPVGRFKLKGKADAMAVFEIVAEKAAATGAQKTLCERFSAILQLYQQNEWRQALEATQALLDTHPDDGPAHFYLARCCDYLASPPESAPGAVIVLESK